MGYNSSPARFKASGNKRGLLRPIAKNDYFEAGIQPLLEKTDVHYIDISEYPCLEIDFIEDLESARELFKDKR